MLGNIVTDLVQCTCACLQTCPLLPSFASSIERVEKICGFLKLTSHAQQAIERTLKLGFRCLVSKHVLETGTPPQTCLCSPGYSEIWVTVSHLARDQEHSNHGSFPHPPHETPIRCCMFLMLANVCMRVGDCLISVLPINAAVKTIHALEMKYKYIYIYMNRARQRHRSAEHESFPCLPEHNSAKQQKQAKTCLVESPLGKSGGSRHCLHVF